MIEVRSFEGGPDELSAFVTSVWKQSYEGTMAFPLWSADYFDWQLGLSAPSPPKHLVAAYDAGRLVGTILAFPCDFATTKGVLPGIFSSWLSIASDARGQGLVSRLKTEQERRCREAGGRFIFAYRYVGSRRSLSRKPTDAELASGEWSIRKIGFWVRILDPARAAPWYVEPLDRWLTRLSAPFVRAPRPARPDSCIREFRASDAAECVALLNTANVSRKLSIHWDESRLIAHCTGFGRCLVAEQEGRIKGLVTFHVLPFSARKVEPVGIMDLLESEELDGRNRRALLNAALAEIRGRGAVLCLKLKTGAEPTAAMLAAGFIPWIPNSYEALRQLDSQNPLPIDGPQSMLWR